MAVPIETVLLYAIAQKGDRYVFGAEANALWAAGKDPDKWDCSELIEISCLNAGVVPRVPDGAFNQYAYSRDSGMLIPVEKGITTRGACLFVGDGTGTGRNAITHVAFSLGDGTTIEARGSKWGVGSWASYHRFNFAGLFPGINYVAAPPPFPIPPTEYEETTMDIIVPTHAAVPDAERNINHLVGGDSIVQTKSSRVLAEWESLYGAQKFVTVDLTWDTIKASAGGRIVHA